MNQRKSFFELIMCTGCGDMFERRKNLDVSLWGKCPLCKSSSLEEYFRMIEEHE